MKMLIVGLAFAVTAVQGGAQLSHRYDQCVARARTNAVQVNICVQKEMAFQDSRLNDVYRARKISLRTEVEKSAFKQEELAWLKKRDATCRINGDTVDTVCLVRETASRAEELKSRP